MFLDVTQMLIVCPLVFLGGLVDAIAGGGGLIALPAYLLAGVPPHMAIGTNKLSSCIGMAVSTGRLYRSGFIDLRLAAAPVAAGFAGSLLGAKTALAVPPEIFSLVLVLCLPFAAFVVMRKKAVRDETLPMSAGARRTRLAACGGACGFYDGFYGPGAGTFMLILFSSAAGLGVRDAAGQMKIVNIMAGTAAFLTFALAGEVDWTLGAAAAVFGIAGHWIGSGLVINNGTKAVRPIILGVLLLLFLKTGWDYFS